MREFPAMMLKHFAAFVNVQRKHSRTTAILSVPALTKDMNFGLPASKLVDTTAFEAKAPYNKYFVEALETAVPYPTNLNGSAFQTMFQKECESLWAGAITPEEFETRVDEQAAEILNK